MKKKVCFLVGVLRDGGAQRSAANISLLLQDRYDISFVTFSSDKAAYEYGGKLYDLHLPRKWGKVQTIVNDFRRIHALKRLKKEIRPDVTISSLDDSNIANAFTHSGDTRVMWLHTDLTARNAGRFSTVRSRIAYKRADKVIAVSQLAGEDIVRLGWTEREKVVSISNMVDGGKLLDSPDPHLPRPAGFPLVTSMGSLSAQKSMWNLIRAFTQVLEVYPTAHLMIFGGGRQEKYLKLINELGIGDHVTLEGYVLNPHHLMKQADMFILPSRFEGMPNAIIEAMALGLPVISTDSQSGPREILAPDTDILSGKRITDIEYAEYGILIPVPKGEFLEADVGITDEEKVMAEAVIRLAGSEEMRDHYRQKSVIRSKEYSPENVRKKWTDFLDSI